MEDPALFAQICVIRRDGQEGAKFPMAERNCLFGRYVAALLHMTC